MRIVMLAGACVLAACASNAGLTPAPPSGVDLTGHWTLDEADSDDAQRLLQSQLKAATQTASGGGQAAGRRGAAGPTALGPMMPPVTVLDEGLRWPGKEVSIKQSGAAVTFASGGSARDCQLQPAKAPPHSSSATRGRGDAPPPRCGWDQGTLVVQSGEPEEDHPPYEQRFSLSPDGQQLVEVILFKGGRSDGFSASRVWNRATAAPAMSSSTSRQ
jgi:hypothetical protein